MKSFTLPLSDSQATLENVGGKGMSLAKMIGAGFPVPDGFHITTESYRTFIKANDLQTKILATLKPVNASLPATLEAASVSISRLFADAPIPTDITEAIRASYLTLPHPTPSPTGRGARDEEIPVAVRSSATAEDLPEASFAGQQETFLNIRGDEDLLDAVKKCWASLWTARAIAYRIKNNIDQKAVALAVVVQVMVDAEAAGILFTANPINGRRDEMVINAAWGLGEAIVGGLVSPDTIVAEKATGKVKSYEVAEKTVITVRTEKGTREDPEPDRRLHAHWCGGFDAKPTQPALHHVGNPRIEGANEAARRAPRDGFARIAGRLLHRYQQLRLYERGVSCKSLVVDHHWLAARLSKVIAQTGSDLA